ncbi:MAG: hypothetical protein JST04_01670 [Bdellovibrionales bacterium]|nr:hypothetical protein [Bdellovibrionales bacterium]
MNTLLRFAFLTLALGLSPIAQAADCYRDVCVGDRAINISRDNREVTVLGIDNVGKFVLRFEDNGGVGGNWDREDLALMRGCAGDVCVGYPAINVSRNYRTVKIHAIQWNGKFVLRFDDNGGVGGNWDRSDLAVAWGCVANLCVNDTVYNKSNSRQAKVVAIQTNANGTQTKMVLQFIDNGGVGGGWELNDLVLLQRGPTAYPPSPPIPACPPGTHWDPRANACVNNPLPPPPPPPSCPPGTHYDPRTGRCIANPPPPPPAREWQCQITRPGKVFTGHGPTRAAATNAVLQACARGSSGGTCSANEAVCRQ